MMPASEKSDVRRIWEEAMSEQKEAEAVPVAPAVAPVVSSATFFGGVRAHKLSAPRGTSKTRAAAEAQKADALRVTAAVFEDAIALHRAGDAAGALRLFEQALGSYRRYLKPGDPLIVKTLNNIAAT